MIVCSVPCVSETGESGETYSELMDVRHSKQPESVAYG